MKMDVLKTVVKVWTKVRPHAKKIGEAIAVGAIAGLTGTGVGAGCKWLANKRAEAKLFPQPKVHPEPTVEYPTEEDIDSIFDAQEGEDFETGTF